METVRSISIEEANKKPLKWFKEQYIMILEEDAERKRKNARYHNEYYAKNREKILQNEKERKIRNSGIVRPRGRPRKHEYIEIETNA